MSKELAVSQKSDGSSKEKQVALIKQMFCKGLTDVEADVFALTCQRTGLDPYTGQIYAVKRWDAQLGKEVMSIQTGIAGYRLIAERTGCYAPGREPTFTYDKNGHLISATAYVKKLTKDGTWHEVAATAFYSEYVQKKKDGTPTKFWANMPHSQTAKCAESLALRRAFTADLAGLMTTEEMSQAEEENVIAAQVQKVNALPENSNSQENIEPIILPPEEIDQFYAAFNHEKENVKLYFKTVQESTGWSESAVILSAKNNPKQARTGYNKWLKNQTKQID